MSKTPTKSQYKQFLTHLSRYFISGNAVAVERAVIPAKDFFHLVNEYLYSPIPTDKLRDCPHCACLLDINDPDTIYPSGILWSDCGEDGKVYGVSRNNANGECFKIVCRCGAEMHGDTYGEVIKQWNQRK